MNREEEIERFRSEKLPEYIELAKTEAWVVEKPIKPLNTTVFRKCSKCKNVKPVADFSTKNICRDCHNKDVLKNYNSTHLGRKYKKKENLIKKCSKCGKELFDSETYGRYRICKSCKIQYQMQRYYNNRVEYYKEKLQDVS